LNTKRREKKRT